MVLMGISYANVLALIGVLLVLCQSTAGAAATLETQRVEMLDRINAFRGARDLGSLEQDSALNRAALDHARDMAKMHEMSHNGSDNSDLADRLQRVCYAFWTAAENIAAGGAEAAGVVARWIASKPHLENMLIRDLSHVGIGHSNAFPGDPFRHYWTLILAKPRSLSSDCVAEKGE